MDLEFYFVQVPDLHSYFTTKLMYKNIASGFGESPALDVGF